MIFKRWRNLIAVFVIGFFIFLQSSAFAFHKVINFQIESAYPPFEYEYNGKAYGFAVDLASLIFEQDKYILNISFDTWPRVYSRLVDRKIDLTGLMAILDERKEYMLFSKPVLSTHVGIYTRKDYKNITLRSIDGLKFGVQKTSFTENLLKDRLKVKNYKSYLTISSAIDALLKGEIDALLEAQEVANHTLLRSNHLNDVKLQIKDVFAVDFAYGVNKNKPEIVNYINSRLDVLKNNGVFDQIYYNYFSTYPPSYYERRNKNIIMSVLFSLVLATLVFGMTIGILSLINKKLKKNIKTHEEYTRIMTENANVIVVTLKVNGDILSFNRFAESITEYKKEEVVGKNWIDIFIPEHKKLYMRGIFQQIEKVKVLNNQENEIITKSGKVLNIMWNNVLIESSHLDEAFIISTGVDITSIKQTQKMLEESFEELEESNEELKNTLLQLKKHEEQLIQEEERYRFIVENVSDGIWEYELDKKEISFYGYLPKYFNLQGLNIKSTFHNWLKLYHPDDVRNVLETLRRAIELKNSLVEYEARFADIANSYRWINTRVKIFYDEHDNPVKMLGINIDITAKKEYEDKIVYLAYHDPLTGLANRKYFEEMLEKYLKTANEKNIIGAVVLFDIDNFKDINDIFGHTVGDSYLKEMGKRISEYLSGIKKKDTLLCRFGGDEFAIILNRLSHKDEAISICGQIQEIFRNECYLEDSGHTIRTTISMGVAYFPDDAKDVMEILRNVDMALSAAKEGGKNEIQVYMQFLYLKNLNKIETEKELRKAIANDEFVLYYQPIVDLNTFEIVELEALIRWISQTKGVILPHEFIPIAEETGHIIKLGEMVIEKAIKDIEEFSNKGLNLKVSVNISAKQFRSKYFLELVENFIRKYNFARNSLSFEITESTAMEDYDMSLNILNSLIKAGIGFIIDDFGTGYSSLVYLKNLPINGIKIDRSFISDIEYSKENQTIVEGITLMAHKLNLKVVAEGIETKRQVEFLRSIGCDCAQGYLFSRPLPKKDVEKLVANKKILI